MARLGAPASACCLEAEQGVHACLWAWTTDHGTVHDPTGQFEPTLHVQIDIMLTSVLHGRRHIEFRGLSPKFSAGKRPNRPLASALARP